MSDQKSDQKKNQTNTDNQIDVDKIKFVKQHQVIDRNIRSYALLSNSPIKIEALRRVLLKSDFINESQYHATVINAYQINDPDNQIEQPIDDGGRLAAENRLNLALNNKELMANNDFIVVIENYMYSKTGEDHVYVILYAINQKLLPEAWNYKKYTLDQLRNRNHHKFCVQAVDMELFNHMLTQYFTHPWGCTRSYGELLHEKDPTVPAKDWMSRLTPIPRMDVLIEALTELFHIH